MPASSIPASELSVDPLLGYPPAFSALCSQPPPFFPVSPPLCFVPCPFSDHQAATRRELDALFPIIKNDDVGKEESSKRRLKRSHARLLWSQLHHLGNAGFDPAEFRIDPYGNVLHWNADPSSPLAWDVDHWFPQSRGGKTVSANLRLVQWQASQRKGQNLEFLMPWWDLQLGISVAQFLLIYASTNYDFRHRAFSLLFHRINDANAHLQKHKWPPQFKKKTERHGYSAAAVVRVNKGTSGASSDIALDHGHLQLKWLNTEAEASMGDVRTHGGVCEIPAMEKPQPESDGTCTVKELAEGLMARCSLNMSYVEGQREARRELILEVETKKEEVLLMERELNAIRHHNERERLVLGELESTLEKHKKQLEKQRHWSETQSHYRKCLERIIRDTLHQSFIFRDQTKINQAACSALLAKIKSHKADCEKAESDLIRKTKQRRALEILAHLDLDSTCQRVVQERLASMEGLADGEDSMVTDKILGVDNAYSRSERSDEVGVPSKCMGTIAEQEEHRETESEQLLCKSPLKRKVASEADDARHVYQRQRIEADFYGSSGHRMIRDDDGEEMGDEHQIDEYIQEMLVLRRRNGDSAAPADDDLPTTPETEEERLKRLGKSNVDKWLQKLLLSSVTEDRVDKPDADDTKQGLEKDRFPSLKKKPDAEETVGNEKSRKVLDGLLRAMSFRQYGGRKKLKVSRDNPSSKDASENSRGQEEQERREDGAEEQEALMGDGVTAEQEAAEGSEVGDGGRDVDTEDSREWNDDRAVFPSDVDFVKRMKEIRDKERRKPRSRHGAGAAAHQWRSTGGRHSQPRSKRGQAHNLHHHRHHPHPHQQGPAMEASVIGDNGMALRDQTSVNAAASSFDPVSAPPAELKRSHSMRAPPNARRTLHIRSGSELLSASLPDGNEEDRDEIMLHPSWSLRTGNDTEEGHRKSLKDSLKTCTKAWKFAVSQHRKSAKKAT